MITAVDTNVLLDVFTADPRFGESSKEKLGQCLQDGRLVASAPVVAEVASAFSEYAAAHSALDQLQVVYGELPEKAAYLAGELFREYRARGGSRERVVADFLIGAHAMVRADRLLTRDRGFYRTYFEDLPIVDPTPPGEA